MAWKIDTSHSQIQFSVRHLMISTVRGRFDRFEGMIHLDEGNLADSRIEGTVYTDSIDTNDRQRDEHLRSADFFDVGNHLTMTFRSRSIKATGDDQYDVSGDLTIRGTTRPVTFKVTDEGSIQDPWGSTRHAFSAEATVDRRDFGLTWNVALEAGGVLVGDKVKITADVQLVKESVAEPEHAMA